MGGYGVPCLSWSRSRAIDELESVRILQAWSYVIGSSVVVCVVKVNWWLACLGVPCEVSTGCSGVHCGGVVVFA